MTSVYENCKLNRLRTSPLNKSVNSCPGTSSGIDNVVDYYNSLISYIKVNIGSVVRCRSLSVVAIRGNIQRAARYLYTLKLLNFWGNSFSKGHASRINSYNTKVFRSPISFQYFICYSCNRASHGIFIHNNSFSFQATTSQTQKKLICRWQISLKYTAGYSYSMYFKRYLVNLTGST